MGSSANRYAAAALLAAFMYAPVLSTGSSAAPAECGAQQAAAPVVHYRTASIDGVDIFYREAGPADAPVVLLLHGFPTSSHMFRNLIPALADRYHVIAPDYPGSARAQRPTTRNSPIPSIAIGELVDGLLGQLGAQATRCTSWTMARRSGYRLALKHPERVTALIVQNGNAYDEGLKEFWDPIKEYWADGSAANRQALMCWSTPETTKFQYTDGVCRRLAGSIPDNWIHDQALLDRPGNSDIQLDLFHDYGTNVPLYPQFQAFFRKYKPPTLIVWGKNDYIFPADGALPTCATCRRRISPHRYRPFRPRRQVRRNGAADPRLPAATRSPSVDAEWTFSNLARCPARAREGQSDGLYAALLALRAF